MFWAAFVAYSTRPDRLSIVGTIFECHPGCAKTSIFGSLSWATAHVPD
jgi:hypothetical protein